jgi:hypothetical protein
MVTFTLSVEHHWPYETVDEQMRVEPLEKFTQ